MIIIPLGILAILSLAFFVNAYILCGFSNSGMRPKSLLGKLGLLVIAMVPLAPIGFHIEEIATKIDLSVELGSLRILLLAIIGLSLFLGLCSTWLSTYWLNKTYYI